MNIFALDRDPYVSAAFHCDKHTVKMILEYAQLLSAAHRVLDGSQVLLLKPTGRLYEAFILAGEEHDGRQILNPKCYKLTHRNHPCAIWARVSDANYHWLVQLFEGCLREYTKRYGKIHASEKLLAFFRNAPKNIPRGVMTPFALAMPDQYKVEDEILSYQNFYVGDKVRFARWTNTPTPKFFADRVPNAADFERTRTIRAR